MEKLQKPFRKVEESSFYADFYGNNNVGKTYIFVVFLNFCCRMKHILKDFTRDLHIAFYGYTKSYDDLLKFRREFSSLRNSIQFRYTNSTNFFTFIGT